MRVRSAGSDASACTTSCGTFTSPTQCDETPLVQLLYVTNGFPYPLTSGYLRHYFLIRELSERHSITLLSIVGATHDESHVAALAPYTERILTVSSASGSGSFLPKARDRLSGFSFGAGGDGPAQRLGRIAADLVRRERFEAILFSGKRTFPALAYVPDLPLVADICDTASARVRGSMRFSSPLRVPVLSLQYVEFKRVERELARRASSLLFSSARDRDALLDDVRRHGLEPRTAVVPNGVDIDYWKRRSPSLGEGRVVFTGKMDYPPNEDAALLLIREVMPIVRRSFPGAELLVVGRDPTDRLCRAGQAPGVTVTGFVDDVRPYLDGAGVFAAPLRFGAGIQNKVLEAMAMEVPVVASPLAADGLRTGRGETPPIVVARSADHVAGRIVERLALGGGAGPDRAARAYVEEHFVWSESARIVDDALTCAVSVPAAEPVRR